MNITTMLRDLFKSVLSRPATEPYPAPVSDKPDRLRGKLHWNPDNCTGCQLCVKDCPSNALKLFVLDKKAKQFVLRYDAAQCTFCAQCVENCRFNCLKMANDDWALVNESKANFVELYGSEENVQQWLADDADKTPDSGK